MRDDRIVGLLKENRFREAGAELYAYFPVVKKLILKNSGSSEDAEDVYQDGLMILMEKVKSPDFVLSSSLKTYLYSVCRYVWSDRLKQRDRMVMVDVEKMLVLNTNEEGEFLKREQEDRLSERAFLRLGDKCRDLLVMFYFRKLPMKEIADRLGFSSEQVAKNQKYRCLEKAKAELRALKTNEHGQLY